MANPISPVPYVQRPSTRLVASGTQSLASLASITISGSNNRQDRIQIVITNLDALLVLKVQTTNGVNFGTIYPQLPWTIETSADIVLYNPGGQAVQYEVGELYPDLGALNGVQRRIAGVTAGGSGGAPAGGGSSYGGGSYSGGSSSGGGHQAQPP